MIRYIFFIFLIALLLAFVIGYVLPFIIRLFKEWVKGLKKLNRNVAMTDEERTKSLNKDLAKSIKDKKK